MPDGSGNDGDSVEVRLEGSHLHVDARPARLVSMLRGGGGGSGAPVVTAQREGGDSLTRVVPPAARQVTFLVAGPLSVEATSGSDFVALAEEGGRQVVVAFNGEVTVLPSGASGDRFALGAHEALLVPAGGGEPRVVPVDDLSDEDQDEISAVMERASLADVRPSGSASSADEPTQALPVEVEAAAASGTGGDKTAAGGDKTAAAGDKTAGGDKTAAAGDKTAAGDKGGAAAAGDKTAAGDKGGAAAAAGATGTAAAKKAGGAAKRNPQKKGKKGRPQQQTKKQAPLVPAATTSGAGVRKASTPPTAQTPVKKSTAPAKKATSGKAVATATGDDSYEDTPSDRRFIVGAIALAALVAVVLAVFFLTDDSDDATNVAADATTTTDATTTSTEAEPASTTTSAPAAAVATTTTAPRTTTTTAPTTTTAARATTTTAAAPAVKYGIEPKSCVQNANNSITYTATITNQSTAAFDYTVRVGFRDSANTSVATSDAKIADLAAGKSVDFTATGTPNRNLAGTGNCNVEKVDATPST